MSFVETKTEKPKSLELGDGGCQTGFGRPPKKAHRRGPGRPARTGPLVGQAAGPGLPGHGRAASACGRDSQRVVGERDASGEPDDRPALAGLRLGAAGACLTFRRSWAVLCVSWAMQDLVGRLGAGGLPAFACEGTPDAGMRRFVFEFCFEAFFSPRADRSTGIRRAKRPVPLTRGRALLGSV